MNYWQECLKMKRLDKNWRNTYNVKLLWMADYLFVSCIDLWDESILTTIENFSSAYSFHEYKFLIA